MEYKQANRSLQVITPLGDDVLFIIGFYGTEQISDLFSFELKLIAENSTTIDFSQLVGHDIMVRIATPGEGEANEWRHLSGICASFSQGDRNEEFTSYYAEVVPKVWLLTRCLQSRIFQQKSVPEILKDVLKGFDCDFQLQGQYEHREYCVQYRETDFGFVSRLMEEEGIYYFFEHTEHGHKMVIADSSLAHSDVPGLTKARYDVIEGGAPIGDHIFEWRKTQTLHPSKYTLWDHSFQQPTKNLEAKENILESIQAGSVSHRLKGQPNDPLEIYDYPGGYAVRFDGISPSGGEQSQRLQKILEDNKRTVRLRMEAEAAQSLTIQGSSGCRNFVAGQKFTLERHFDADGEYVLLSVTHDASMGSPYRTGANGGDLRYSNTFSCIPSQLPYRPPRRTPKPFVQGVQNALVTGPPGEEIFTDKYGRVKVQFYWDREGKKDANSSCWLRVGTLWAGKGWGGINIPRIGHEVIVAFVEGNPDEPVIVGSVYNRDTMPANTLPDKKVVCGLKSNTHKGKGYNEISMDDTAGKEVIKTHAQYDMDTKVEHDLTEIIKNNAKIEISEGTYKHDVKTGTANYHVQSALTEVYDATQETTVKGDLTIKSTGGAIVVSADSQHIYIHAATSIQLHTGASKLWMASDGNIELSGTNIAIKGAEKVYVKGGQVVSEADTNHEISGAAVKSTGTATNTVVGGVVMLNP